MEFFVSFGVFVRVLLLRAPLPAPAPRAFLGFFSVTFGLPWRSLRGQRFFMHFVGDGVGFLRRVLVIVFVISFLIGVQRFLQLFEFGGLYKRFGHCFDRLGPLFSIGLRFFVLGFGKLFGKRGYIFLGEVCAIRSMRVRHHPWTRFEIKSVEVASDFFFRVRRSGNILRRAGGWLGPQIRDRDFMFLGNRC